jgi:osmoprotectant transport system permease protein
MKRELFWKCWNMFSDVLQDLLDEGLPLLGEHLVLVLSAILIASAIAIPLGVAIAAHPRARGIALGIANIGQTIPSLALFGFLIPIPFIGGIGAHTAIIALVVYALLPILRNTVTGILGVDATVRDSAVAMGMTRGQILRMVELPIAAPTIIAGLRIATVTTIGTATIAAAIGAGGLGVFIFRGIASVDKWQILAGAVPSALMALGADALLGWLEKRCSVG